MGNYDGPQPCIIFDIDGTLADCEHRRYFVDGTLKNDKGKPKKDFNAFYEAMDQDKPILHMRGIHNMFYLNTWKIVYCTGRPETYRTTTRNWLVSYGFLGNNVATKLVPMNHLLMRPDDRRHDPDYMIKEEMLEHIKTELRLIPEVVFDDRNQVVHMWRRHGIPCLQVAPGDF